MRVPGTASGVDECLGVSPEGLAVGECPDLAKDGRPISAMEKKGTLRDAKRGAIGGRFPIGRSTCPKGRYQKRERIYGVCTP